ncbi:MAG: DNA-binding protein WhiA [Clostridia bacterium]|nr:DNA-binding protein WhiA [Clostridia bacterium]
MPFTNTVKEEICAGLPKKACCRRSFLYGILFMRGSEKGELIEVALEGEMLFDLTERMVAEQFSRECRRIKRPHTIHSQMLTFYSSSAASFLQDLDGCAPENPIEEKCSGCRKSFLSGIFMAAGRVSDPHENYRLEFSCGARRDSLAAFLRTYDLMPKVADRRNEKLLYFRDSTSIEDFFAHIGATQAAFSVMDTKIERGLRNDANRLANCDANNIDKTVAAAMRQTEYIQRLIDENKISFLPPELEATARLRLQYPGLSLVQLAAIADPPMTKSGLNHRLKKIMDAAVELLNDKKGDI